MMCDGVIDRGKCACAGVDEPDRPTPTGGHLDNIRRAEEALTRRSARADRRDRAFSHTKRVGTAEMAVLGPQSSVWLVTLAA